ncbi:RNA ligase family protein [Nonomuraea dietziae]|uniref:RNA ligase family protein n=1 Tax=Nonomuraea dietziae TaxID=65515 RepID=UPI00340BBFBC
MFSLHTADLRKINSLTKYPSIPTYHEIDKRGILHEKPLTFDGPVYGTEKVDGTNARAIMLPDGSWLLGSREDLLTARGDIVANPQLGIVDALAPIADTLRGRQDVIVALYFEVYGSKQLPAWKQYGNGEPAVRLFDAAVIDLDMLGWQIEAIASWRQNGGQPFLDEADLQQAAALASVELAPRLFEIDGGDLPAGIQEMRDFMQPYSLTRVATGPAGESEGIVLRTADRKVIAKARFKDYDRALKHLIGGSLNRHPRRAI